MKTGSSTSLLVSRTAIALIATLLLVHAVFAQTPRSSFSPGLDDELTNYYGAFTTLRAINQRIADATAANAGEKPKEVVIEKSWTEKFVDYGSPLARQTKISPLLLSALANCELVIVGAAIDLRSLPIKDNTFLFTEYAVRVDRVFYDKSHAVAAGDTIILSREGGVVEIDDITIKAIEPEFEQFSLNRSYAFALKAIPGTESYRALAPWTFVIADGLVSSSSKLEVNTGRKKSLPDFISELEAAVAVSSHRKNGEK